MQGLNPMLHMYNNILPLLYIHTYITNRPSEEVYCHATGFSYIQNFYIMYSYLRISSMENKEQSQDKPCLCLLKYRLRKINSIYSLNDLPFEQHLDQTPYPSSFSRVNPPNLKMFSGQPTK